MNTILLMHNNDSILLSLTVKFTCAGFTVHSASNPKDAIRLLAKLHADGIKVQFLLTEFNPSFIIQVNRLFTTKILVVKLDSNGSVNLALPKLPAIRSYLHKQSFQAFRTNAGRIAAINKMQNRKAELANLKFKRIKDFRISLKYA